MKIFLSWSGGKSSQFAQAFGAWLPKVLQGVEPFYSPEEINKGAMWFKQIVADLNNAEFGIVFLTRDNREKPWLLFEAGALAIRLDGRVCPIAMDFDVGELRDPLAQLNAASITKKDIFRVLQSVNVIRDARRLSDTQLMEAFDVWWPKLDLTVGSEVPISVINADQMLKEILLKVQQIEQSQAARAMPLPQNERQFTALLSLRKVMSVLASTTSKLSAESKAGSAPPEWLIPMLVDVLQALEDAGLSEFFKSQISRLRMYIAENSDLF